MKEIRRRILGRYAEDIAVRFLKRKGFKIIERNFFCRIGEIDIVARDADELVFVEVRSSGGCGLADPLESIRGIKIKRLKNLALVWLNLHRIQEYDIRFDVMAIVFNKKSENNIPERFFWRKGQAEIRHIKNIF